VPDDWRSEGFVSHYNRLYGPGRAEVAAYLARLRLVPGDVFVDFGCGQGDMLAVAAETVQTVVGVDVSPQQLALARERLEGRSGARLIESAFLDFRWDGEPFTKGAARKALHHLDDQQKGEFLRQVAPHFAPGALFILEDGVFDFDRAELEARMPAVLEEAAVYYQDAWEAKRKDFVECLRHEFPTGRNAWEGAFAGAGFEIVDRWQASSFYGGLLARKTP